MVEAMVSSVKNVASALMLGVLMFVLSGCGADAPYPNKTITIVCPWAAGGGTDRLSRFIAADLKKRLGVPCVVANRTGGKGAVGHSYGANARPDGYTITMGTFELSTMHWMGISPLTYQDFTPLMQLNADAAALFVKADSPWADVSALFDEIKSKPKAIKMSGTATGGAWDLARAGMMLTADVPVDDVIWVPSQGSAPSIKELLGGHVDVVCCSLPEAAAQVQNGSLRALCVMAAERHPDFPGVPTLEESGVSWDALGWRALLLPKDIPAEVADLLRTACHEIVQSEAFHAFMEKNGFAVDIKQGDDLLTYLAQQDAQWESVIAEVGYAAAP